MIRYTLSTTEILGLVKNVVLSNKEWICLNYQGSHDRSPQKVKHFQGLINRLTILWVVRQINWPRRLHGVKQGEIP